MSKIYRKFTFVADTEKLQDYKLPSSPNFDFRVDPEFSFGERIWKLEVAEIKIIGAPEKEYFYLNVETDPVINSTNVSTGSRFEKTDSYFFVSKNSKTEEFRAFGNIVGRRTLRSINFHLRDEKREIVDFERMIIVFTFESPNEIDC